MKQVPSHPHAIVPPGSGKVLHAYGEQVTVLLSGKETGGKYTMFLNVTPPGGGPPPHYHENEDEWFFPLEGRVEFFVDGAWKEVPMGTAVFMPKNKVHSFRNPGSTPLKQLIHTAPSGFENFFERSAEEFAKPGPPNFQRLIQIGAEHGIHFEKP